MSANQITAADIVQYIGNLLNIDVSGKLIIMDMIEDLKSIQDLAAFRIFVKERFNYERFKYLTGYQKFLALANEFKKENKLILSDKNQQKVGNYSNKLFNKITEIMDEINFELQIRGKTIDSLDLYKTLQANGIKEDQMSVLNKIGDKKKLFHLAIYGKEQLKNLIESIVYEKTMQKEYPLLNGPKNFEGLDVMKKLKAASSN